MNDSIKQILDKVNRCPENIKLYLSDEEYDICIKHGISPNRIFKKSEGSGGHRLTNKQTLGRYITGVGYYKIIDIKYNYKVPDGRVFEEMLVTNYNRTYTTHFNNEEVLINPRPLYNIISKGPKISLKPGMILHIIEDTTVVNESYKIVWEIL